jgi:hypothetical protein
MRGGNTDLSSVQPTVVEQTNVVEPTSVMTIGEKAKHATRKAVDWLKGWFGVGEQQPQMGGRRNKTRRHRSRKH